MWKSIME